MRISAVEGCEVTRGLVVTNDIVHQSTIRSPLFKRASQSLCFIVQWCKYNASLAMSRDVLVCCWWLTASHGMWALLFQCWAKSALVQVWRTEYRDLMSTSKGGANLH